MANVLDEKPRPMKPGELVKWLGNIEAMHARAGGVTAGGPSFMCYHDGMAEAAKFIRQCAEQTVSIPLDHVVACLNRLVEVDAETAQSLVEMRFFCSKKVEGADCPAVPTVDERGNLMLGLLGVINGFMPPTHRVVGHYTDDDRLTGFTVVELVGEENPRVA